MAALFLDEIGEIEAPIQAKLLRVLETGHFRRLGGTKDLSADVRIVAATNQNLEEMSRKCFRFAWIYIIALVHLW
ncbi:MAG: sigma 54-interacting transcriptional regulator [Thiotrichaceae bacterium]